jgi:membrane protein DedA with SNARE-associated domain
MVLGTIIWIVGIVCALWVIIDVFTNNKRLSTGMKVLWIVLAIFFSIITAIVYYLVGRKGKHDLFK